MADWRIWLPPALSLVLLVAFASTLWVTYSHRPKYQEGTKEHSERIYRDFEFFVKIFIALVGAVGYVRLKEFSDAPDLARQGMIAVGGLGLFSMTTLALFVICHQGSKIRRWKTVEWKTIFFWQEVWMLTSMFTMATSLWIGTWLW